MKKTASGLLLQSFIETVTSNPARLEKIAKFISHNKPRMNTRLSPFRGDVSKKLKPTYTIEAPAKNVVSTGKADSGPIASDSGANSSGGGAP